jgi:hypothetical protein
MTSPSDPHTWIKDLPRKIIINPAPQYYLDFWSAFETDKEHKPDKRKRQKNTEVDTADDIKRRKIDG